MRRLLHWVARVLEDDSAARAFGFDGESPLAAVAWHHVPRLA